MNNLGEVDRYRFWCCNVEYRFRTDSSPSSEVGIYSPSFSMRSAPSRCRCPLPGVSHQVPGTTCPSQVSVSRVTSPPASPKWPAIWSHIPLGRCPCSCPRCPFCDRGPGLTGARVGRTSQRIQCFADPAVGAAESFRTAGMWWGAAGRPGSPWRAAGRGSA